MPSLVGTKTGKNLKAAFAKSAEAHLRYLYFAQKADIEGYNDVSAVFRSTAVGETGHAHGHLDFLAEVGDPVTGKAIGATADNLTAAIASETYDYTDKPAVCLRKSFFSIFDRSARCAVPFIPLGRAMRAGKSRI